MNSYIRIVATQCSVGTWFVSGIYSVDTLRKGDTEDDDDDNNNNNNNNNNNRRFYKCDVPTRSVYF
jgi:hypothetical protein